MQARSNTGNGWYEYQQLVLHELQKHSEDLQLLRAEIAKLHIDITSLQVKSGVWGLMGGLIPVILLLGLQLLKTFGGP